jgi:hypothetical protein
MTFILNRLADSWLTRKDLDYHVLRASSSGQAWAGPARE